MSHTVCWFALFCVLVCASKHKVRCETTAGPFAINLDTTYSPLGVARFLDLVKDNYFDDQIMYRVIENFIVQFGVAADPNLSAKYAALPINDEPNLVNFRPGTVSFAGHGANTRTCHIFVALDPYGSSLGGAAHETTIGHLDKIGMKTIRKVVAKYKATGYHDTGALQTKLVNTGNSAAADYPLLDRIQHCKEVGKKKKTSKKHKIQFIPPGPGILELTPVNFNAKVTFSTDEVMFLVQFGTRGIDAELALLAPALKEIGVSMGYFDCGKTVSALCEQVLGDVDITTFPDTQFFAGHGPKLKNIGAGRSIGMYGSRSNAVIDTIVHVLKAVEDMKPLEEEEEEEEIQGETYGSFFFADHEEL